MSPPLFAGLDATLLDRLTVLRSVCVAVWCWALPAKIADAEEHTGIVREWLRQRG